MEIKDSSNKKSKLVMSCVQTKKSSEILIEFDKKLIEMEVVQSRK